MSSSYASSDKRYDCFISFHGSQRLSTLDFEGLGLNCTVGQLARKVNNSLLSFERKPSVFCDERAIEGNCPDVSHAILQLRGGGVALVLLTAEYLTCKYCLAELRAFLELKLLGSDDGRRREAIDIRVVVLEKDERVVYVALEDCALKQFIRAELINILDARPLPVEKRSTCGLVVQEIRDRVFEVWNDKEVMCLGEKLEGCVFHLAEFFNGIDPHLIAHKLGFRPEEDFSNGLSLRSVFLKASGHGKFSEFNLKQLSEITSRVHAKDAVKAFQRKWCSGAWSWSLVPGENDFYLPDFVEEAGRALGKKRGQSPQSGESGPSAATGGKRVKRADDSSDRFRPSYPTWHSSDDALEPDAAICLAQLKAKVLPATFFGDGPPDEGHSGGAGDGWTTRRVALTSVSGEGGVGKTSACKLLCKDEAIREYFAKGAILWIDVGLDANEEKVVGELQRAVSDCGGKLAAKEIKECENVSHAVKCARGFFSERRLLVIVDNVWGTPPGSPVKSWADTLSGIIECSESAIVLTTRLASLARAPGFVPVSLDRLDVKTEGSADWSIAENLYDSFLNESSEKRASDGYKNNRRRALRLSCGLPLGITAIAGLMRCYPVGFDKGDVLAGLEQKERGLASESVGEAQKSTTGHDGLFSVMKLSLSYLDERKGQTFVTQSASRLGHDHVVGTHSLIFRASYEAYQDKFYSARYAALKVMPASTLRLSFEVLCPLWHANVAEAVDIAADFVNIGLGRIEGGGESGRERVFALHDLQYEFCSRSSHESVDGHALLLSSCYSLMASKSAKSSAALWAQFCFRTLSLPDAALWKYMSNNLIRHLCSVVPAQSSSSSGEGVPSAAVLKQEIWSLLCNFCWLRGRLGSSWGRNYLLRDFRCVFESGSLDDSEAVFLDKLEQALVMRGDVLSETDGTLASSVVQLDHSIKAENNALSADVDCLLGQLVASAVEEVRGAWLRPVSGCYNSYEPGVLRKAVLSSAAVVSLSSLGDGTHFVSLSDDGKVRIHDQSSLGNVLVIRDINRTSSIAVVQQRRANGPSCIFTGDANGAVCVYEVSFDETGRPFESRRASFGKTNSPVTCLFASKDGKIVAAGCVGIVYLWKFDGSHFGSCEPRSTLLCFSDATDKGEVVNMVVSGSGDFLAACIPGEGLHVWREGQESAKRVRKQGAEAAFVFLSSDETRLIVLCDGFSIEGPSTCEIWNIEAGEHRLMCVELSDLCWIRCADLEGTRRPFCLPVDEKIERSLLVGGADEEFCNVLLEYSIGEDVHMVRRCRLSSSRLGPLCRLDFSDVTGQSTVVFGDRGRCVSLLKLGAPDSGESGMRVENAIYPTSPEELDNFDAVFAVAVMPVACRVVAGHKCGRLSLWSAKDGKIDRVIDSGRELESVRCIDISADESIAVTGHWRVSVVVWDVKTWSVRCVLEGHSEDVCCVAALGKDHRIFSADWDGECRVWDSERGGAALEVIKTGLYFSFDGHRAFVSPDGGHILWARRRVEGLWRAKVIDAGRLRVVFESDEHWKWEELCAQVDAVLTDTETIGSWKKAAVSWNKLCELPFNDRSGRSWLISSQASLVQCHLESTEGTRSDTASINFDSDVGAITAQWLPHRGQDGRRRAIVACSFGKKNAPAILHFTTPNV